MEVVVDETSVQRYSSVSMGCYFEDEWGYEWTATVRASTNPYEDAEVTWDEDPPVSEDYDIDEIECEMADRAYDILHQRRETL
jgi:hypothetical protein